jgi:hypothetical protein
LLHLLTASTTAWPSPGTTLRQDGLARRRQLAATCQQAFDDAAFSRLHAGTKSPDILTAGRLEFGYSFTLRPGSLRKS